MILELVEILFVLCLSDFKFHLGDFLFEDF